MAFNRFGIAGLGLRLQRQWGTRINGLDGDPALAAAYAPKTLPRQVGFHSGDKVDKSDKGD
ncbi:hypothetical protein GCM10009097_55480 [Pigmentiphaga daeguensis]|uniref:Uncharacterized protein n=1 Tax=Pigmentiphaga daeguensis TaxID=414049 RepID=A0ABN1D0H4_9BURK